MRRFTYLLFVTFLWSFQSCKIAKPASAGNTGLQDTYWRLTELMGKPLPITPPGKREVYIKLITEGKKLEVFAGCNGVGGVYELGQGNRIRFSNLIGTMMACDDLPTENSLLEVLKNADNYNLNGNNLVLNKAKMAPLARFEAVKK